MSMKQPELWDFGITQEQYTLYKGDDSWPESAVGCVVFLVIHLGVGVVTFAVTRELVTALAWGVISMFGFMVTGGVAVLIASGLQRYERSRVLVESTYRSFRRWKRSRLLKSPVASRIKMYEEATVTYRVMQTEAEGVEKARREAERARWEAEEARRQAEEARRRKLREHWMSLSGVEFERELGSLYKQLGYVVRSTPTSGDQGVDLILIKDGKTTVVQCKSHKSPVGPAVVRELYGSLVAYGAHDAILACTGGFTRGVKQFVRGKPITLISASDLATLGGSVPDEPQDRTNAAPICPMPGCGKAMLLKTGRYGRFWGCGGYPRCSGTRDA